MSKLLRLPTRWLPVLLGLTLTADVLPHGPFYDPAAPYDEDPYRVWHRAHRKPTDEEEKRLTAAEYFRFGQSLAHSGWLAKALKPLERATAFDPGNGAYHLTHGMVLLDLNRTEEAISALRKAYKHGDIETRAQAAYELAYLGEIIPAGKTTTAAEEKDRARRNLNTSIAWRHYHYGRLLAQDGWLSRSLGPLNKAIEIEPEQGRFYLTRALVYLDLGSKDKGVDSLLGAYMKGSDWVRAEAAYNLAALGEPVPDAPATTTVSQQVRLGGSVTEELFGLDEDEEARLRARRRGGSSGSVGRTGEVDPGSLYARLGGAPAIRAVVEQFLTNVGNDERINRRFAGVNLTNLQERLVEQIGEATGGSEIYRGSNMRAVHRGMGIKASEFNAMVEDLVSALNRFKVPAKEQSELLSLLGSMQRDIVEVDDI